MPSSYQSPYGPKYSIPPNFHGLSYKALPRLGFMAGGFGAVAGFTVLYLAEGIPRVQKDILQKLPIIGEYWVKEVPPSDNPF